MENPPQLLDIATAVADLTPVDWPALEAKAGDAVARAALKRLRVLDTIVRACADIVPPGTAAPGAADDIQPTTWGPFTIHERIGRGTFGDVYRAHDRRLDRIVALKLLRPGREGADPVESEVIHEGQLLAKARHPNVVTVHGAERIDGRFDLWALREPRGVLDWTRPQPVHSRPAPSRSNGRWSSARTASRSSRREPDAKASW